MTTKRKFQIMVDLMMTAILPLLMAYSLIGETFHEWAGMAMFGLFLLHHALNWKWHKNLFKGRYTAVRIVGTGINIIIFALMLMLMVSGMMMSRYVFRFLPVSGGISFARMVHLSASYWCYILTSVHVGLHGNMIMGMLRKAAGIRESSVIRKVFFRGAAIILAVCGIHAFVNRGFPGYMFLKNHFVFFDYGEAIVFFLIDYLEIMALFAIVGYYATKILTNVAYKMKNRRD